MDDYPPVRQENLSDTLFREGNARWGRSASPRPPALEAPMHSFHSPVAPPRASTTRLGPAPSRAARDKALQPSAATSRQQAGTRAARARCCDRAALALPCDRGPRPTRASVRIESTPPSGPWPLARAATRPSASRRKPTHCGREPKRIGHAESNASLVWSPPLCGPAPVSAVETGPINLCALHEETGSHWRRQRRYKSKQMRQRVVVEGSENLAHVPPSLCAVLGSAPCPHYCAGGLECRASWYDSRRGGGRAAR